MIATWLRKALYRLTARRPARLISPDGVTPYLERYYLCRLGPFTAYLHRFVGSDGDREVHDHPWRAVAICLVGGYLEERMTHLDPRAGWVRRWVRIRPLRPNVLGLRSFHRIDRTEPETWTLFLHGRRLKGWGFLSTENDGTGLSVRYAQTLPASNPTWWEEARLGCEIGREPLRPPWATERELT